MHQGQTQNYVGFILKGGFRYVRYTSEGTEQIVGYSFENDFVVDYGAFQLENLLLLADRQSNTVPCYESLTTN